MSVVIDGGNSFNVFLSGWKEEEKLKGKVMVSPHLSSWLKVAGILPETMKYIDVGGGTP